jgi:hypothetical protein
MSTDHVDDGVFEGSRRERTVCRNCAGNDGVVVGQIDGIGHALRTRRGQCMMGLGRIVPHGGECVWYGVALFRPLL